MKRRGKETALASFKINVDKTKGFIVLAIGLALLYFLIAKASLLLATINSNTSPFWPATGFAIAGVFVFGYRYTSAIFLGAFLANFYIGTDLFSCLLMATGNSLEALLGAAILQGILRRKSEFENFSELTGVVCASLLAPIISASFGTLGVAFSLTGQNPQLGQVWRTWWTGDMIGGLTVIPLILALAKVKWRTISFSPQPLLKFLAAFVLLSTTLWISFKNPSNLGGVFIIFPVLLLMQLYLDHVSLFLGSLGVSILAIVVTTQGVGPFTGGSTNDNLLNLQLFLSSLALTALVLDSLRKAMWNKLPALVLMAAWGVSGLLYAHFQDMETKKDSTHFEILTESLQNAIHTRMNAYIEALYGGANLFSTVRDVTPEIWKTFYYSSKVNERYPGINGVGVIWPVQNKDLPSFLKKQKSRIPGFEIKSVAGHSSAQTSQTYDDRFIITFIEPIKENEPAQGLDVGSEPNRRIAAESSRDTGVPHITPKISLVQDVKSRPGFLLFVPFYKFGKTLTTNEDRKQNHLGWVYAPFVTEVFFTGISAPELKEISMDVFQGRYIDRSELLFSSTPLDSEPQYYDRISTVNLAGLDLTIGWRKTINFVSGRSTLAGWVALACAIFSLLVTIIVSILQSIGIRAQAIADEKTSELRASEQRFRAIVESSMIGTVISEEKGRVVDGNLPFLKMIGYDKFDFHTDSLKWSQLTEDPVFLNSFKQTNHNGEKLYSGELTLKRNDGSVIPVLIGTAPLIGATLRTISYVIDLSENKKTQRELMNSELKFRSVTKSAVDGIVIMTNQGNITSWNEGAKRIFEFAKEDVLNTSIFKLIQFGENDRFTANTEQSFAYTVAPLLGRSAEFQIKTKSKRQLPVELTISSWEIEGERFYSAIIRDISERKKFEQELILAKEKALEGAHTKSTFLANMSHEIRTPLNGIIGVADLLFETELSAEQRRYSEIIQNSGNNLLNIINDILDFSKIEAGKLKLENIPFNMVNLVELQADLLMAKARSKKLSLVSFIDPKLPSEFIGDPSRLGQILSNLISNAIKFTQTGGVKILVRALPSSSKSSEFISVRFDVIDTGIGISQDGVGRLFQSFTQVDDSTSRQYGGTGLGLSISKSLVSLMGGHIQVNSHEGSGSNFFFEVPLRVAKAQDINKSLRPDKLTRSVLFIDNDSFSRETIGAYFSTWGVSHETCSSAEEAIDLIRQSLRNLSPWSLILLNGNAFPDHAQNLKMELENKFGPAAPPIAIIEDFERPLSLEEAKNLGFSHLVRKPIKQSDLLMALTMDLQAYQKTNLHSVSFIEASSQEKSNLKKRILVVDDVATNRLVIVQLLEKIGYLSYAVTSGEEALQALTLMPFDLILMDVQMPGLDGYETTRRIRMLDFAQVRTIPIIALTANALAGDERKCLAAGMDDYLSKPVRKSVLEKKLKTWLDVKPGPWESPTDTQNSPTA